MNDRAARPLGENETLSRPAMKKLQLERFPSGIERVAHHVPFYKLKLQEADVAPESIRTLQDLARLPFTTKADFRDNRRSVTADFEVARYNGSMLETNLLRGRLDLEK